MAICSSHHFKHHGASLPCIFRSSMSLWCQAQTVQLATQSSLLNNREYYRLFTSAMMHRNYQHLGMNLLGCYSTGSEIEQTYGWWYLVRTTLLSILSTPMTYVVLAHVYNFLAETPLKATKGFSGVVFHWMTVESLHNRGSNYNMLFGMMQVPAVWYPWAWCLLIAARTPRSSWLMHISGILTGTLQYHFERMLGCSTVKEKENNVDDVAKPESSTREARLRKFDRMARKEDSKQEKPWSSTLVLHMSCIAAVLGVVLYMSIFRRGDSTASFGKEAEL